MTNPKNKKEKCSCSCHVGIGDSMAKWKKAKGSKCKHCSMNVGSPKPDKKCKDKTSQTLRVKKDVRKPDTRQDWEMKLFEEFEDGDWSYTSVRDLVKKLLSDQAKTFEEMIGENEAWWLPKDTIQFPANTRNEFRQELLEKLQKLK